MIDDTLLYRILEGMESISALILSFEDECDEPEKLLEPLQKLIRELSEIDGLPEQLIRQIKEHSAKKTKNKR